MVSHCSFYNVFVTNVLQETFVLKVKAKFDLLLCCFLTGVKCLDSVVECSCVLPHCYRLSSFEGFPEQYTDSQGNKAMRTKVEDQSSL